LKTLLCAFFQVESNGGDHTLNGVLEREIWPKNEETSGDGGGAWRRVRRRMTTGLLAWLRDKVPIKAVVVVSSHTSG
ncbi:hypothetical protein ABN262_23290, partial [Citrobacter youngae]|uniref:hypothetical protein n=1 Tax=Citrobacter youngae TaxID=133448 RepID=UPI0032DB3711